MSGYRDYHHQQKHRDNSGRDGGHHGRPNRGNNNDSDRDDSPRLSGAESPALERGWPPGGRTTATATPSQRRQSRETSHTSAGDVDQDASGRNLEQRANDLPDAEDHARRKEELNRISDGLESLLSSDITTLRGINDLQARAMTIVGTQVQWHNEHIKRERHLRAREQTMRAEQEKLRNKTQRHNDASSFQENVMEKLVLIESKLLIPDRDVSTTSRRHAEEAAEPESVPPELVADNGELGKLRSDNRRLNDTVNRIRKERNELRESASDQLSLQQENERLTDELEKAREEIVRLKAQASPASSREPQMPGKHEKLTPATPKRPSSHDAGGLQQKKRRIDQHNGSDGGGDEAQANQPPVQRPLDPRLEPLTSELLIWLPKGEHGKRYMFTQLPAEVQSAVAPRLTDFVTKAGFISKYKTSAMSMRCQRDRGMGNGKVYELSMETLAACDYCVARGLPCVQIGPGDASKPTLAPLPAEHRQQLSYKDVGYWFISPEESV